MVLQDQLVSVPELLEQAALHWPKHECIYDLTCRLSYGDMYERVNRLAAGLQAIGIGAGDKVGVSLFNWHETAELFFAVPMIGAVLVPFNPKYRTYEVQHILKNSGVKAVFVSEEFEQVGMDAVRPLVREIITVRCRKEGLRAYEDLLSAKEKPKLPPHPPEGDDIYCILYTSGTTGLPKGVLITHRAVVQSGRTISGALRCTADDVYLVLAPIFHIFGMAVNMIAAMVRGSRMVFLDKFKAEKALELIQQEKVTIHHAVPSMLNLELKSPNFDSYDVSSLRAGVTGAAPCPPETIKAVREKMGMNLCISFGATETSTVTITGYDDPLDKVCGTIGKAVEGVEVKIVGEDRRTLPPGEIGEMAVRGFGVMKGYYQMPEETRKVLDEEGWFYTGDLGMMDEEGYIRYMGRKKELIIRGGYNIYPQELEALLQHHPKVLESAVVGLPDETMGETVCAVVRLKPGTSAQPEEIIDYLKGKIANYKLPGKVVFLDWLPTTASGKIQKNRLREQILQAPGSA
jgi:Acyl-CoA synthetases (AMP-forming)/AMP-acid ligases II